VASEAILLITSLIPVAEGQIRQFRLPPLPERIGQQLLCNRVPHVSPTHAAELAKLCFGMPMLICLVAGALASRGLTVEVSTCSYVA